MTAYLGSRADEVERYGVGVIGSVESVGMHGEILRRRAPNFVQRGAS